MSELELEVQNIHKKFQDHEVLTDANYTFKEDMIYGLLGRNGAGKTTLFNILYGDLKADDGQAEIITDGTRRELVHEDLGMVFAETLLPDFLTGYEYIKFYMDLHASDSERTVDEYLDLFSFSNEERHRIIKGYSSGMKSKLAILCQFISRPKIILLDEPLTAIDIIASAEIKEMLLELRKGRILILSTHIIQLAKDICDDIVLLNNGKLRHFETALNRESFDQSLLEALRGDADVD
jgi:ABC-2 type transport system ATP-binding protein